MRKLLQIVLKKLISLQSITSLVESAQMAHLGFFWVLISLHKLISRFHTPFGLGHTEYSLRNGKPVKNATAAPQPGT